VRRHGDSSEDRETLGRDLDAALTKELNWVRHGISVDQFVE
jgi:hypothetical protein